MQPLKIVFLDYMLELAKPGRSGLSDIVWDMATELVDLHHEVHVVAPYPQSLAPDQRVHVHTVKVPPTGYRWFGGHLWICKRMADVAFKLKPDVVHAPEYVSIGVYNTLYPAQLAFDLPTLPITLFHWLKRKIKPQSLVANEGGLRVVTVPGSIFHKLRSEKGNPYAYFQTQCLKWAARKVATTGTSIIAISNEMKRVWEETGSLTQFTPVIPLGINPKIFHEVLNSRARLGITSDTILLLFIGRFSPEKALVELVETVGKCQDLLRSNNLKIQMFGKGITAPKVAEKIRETGVGDIVTKADWLDRAELAIWYSAADALLLTSYAEGFARVLPEAMSCGTPIIGTNISGTQDVVLSGKTGFLFEPGDFDSLGQILKAVAVNPDLLRQMRSFTKQYAEQHLTWPSIVQKISDEVYLSIPGRNTQTLIKTQTELAIQYRD